MAGKINRLILKGHQQDWDDLIPDTTEFFPDLVVFTFKRDPERLGFPHIRIIIQAYCCENGNRLDECSDDVYAAGILIIRVDFGVKRSCYQARQWVTSTPGNVALIDSRFDFIEQPFRLVFDQCEQLFDSRSEWVDFWGMLVRWVALSDEIIGDQDDFPFITTDSLQEPPICCKTTVVSSGLVPWNPISSQ